VSAGRVAFRRLVVPALVALATAAAGACSELGTDPSAPVSIRFDTLPSAAIVEGDTLRDSLGVVAPLTAIAFNAAGDTIRNLSFTFLARDTTNALTVDPAGRFVVAKDSTARATDVTLQATLGTLQFTRTLSIVRAPNLVSGPSAAVEEQLVLAPDTAALPRKNLSSPFTVRVLHATDTDTTGVRNWLVSFVVDSIDPRLDSARVVDATGARRAILTASDGSATANLRVYPKTAPSNGIVRRVPIYVSAIVRYKADSAIAGSPASFVVPVAICTGPVAGCASAATVGP
jgi:hypothetical protein